MSNKIKNGISKMTKRVNSKFRFYVFHERLKFKCGIRKVNYKLVNESYTSQTCGSCGSIKKNLGSNKKFDCSNCGLSICRDINGSRNIYLKGIL